MNLHFNTDFCVDIPFSNPTVVLRSLIASPCHSPGRHVSAHRCLFNVFVFSGGAGSAAGHGAAFGGGSRVQIRGLCPQRRAGPAHHESPGNMQQAYLCVLVHVGCVSLWLLRSNTCAICDACRIILGRTTASLWSTGCCRTWASSWMKSSRYTQPPLTQWTG